MSVAPIRSRFSRKTLAIALAAGVSFGGVQIVGPEMGLNTVAEASAAELDPSVVTKTELVSDKSGQNVLGTTVEATKEAYDAFYNTHGENFKLKLEFNIPDSAQPGDTFTIKNNGTTLQVSGAVEASTEEGRKVGQLDVKTNGVTFTVSEQVADAQNRKAFFEVPVYVTSGTLAAHRITEDKSLDGKAAESYIRGFSSANEKLVFKVVYKYSAPTVNTTPNLKEWDSPAASSFNTVNLDLGQVVYDDRVSMEIGHANATLKSPGANTDTEATYDDVYMLDQTAKNNRDVTIRYTIDDPQGRLIPTTDYKRMSVYEFSPTAFADEFGDVPSSETKNRSPKFYKKTNKSFEVTHKRINDQTVDVTVHDVPPNYAVNLSRLVSGESPYSPGKKTTVTKTFVNGVGEPHSAYDFAYKEAQSKTYTHPSFDGYGSADDIKRNITMSAKVNGQEADNVNSAQQVKNGKAKFSIDLKNNGNIGASSATVKYPKGITGPKGETEKFIDFGSAGFPAGSTKTLDLDWLNVPEGTNENKFTVIMTGYPELTDAAWTATGPTDIYVDSVKREGDTVTIKRNDGKKFTFKVNDTNGIKDVVDNGDGSITIIRDNGNKEKIDLTHTTVTETNKGTPDHKITITTPDGKKIDFNAFDVYVTDIKKNANGDYDLYRSDVNGGKTVWKTIKFDDLRKEIKDLKGKDKEQDKRLDDLEKQIDDADKNLGDLTDKVNKNEGAIEDHRKTIGDILVKIGNIEGDIKNIQDELTRLDGQDIKEVRDNGDGTYTLIRKDMTEVKGNIDTSGNVNKIVSDGKGNLIVTTVDGNTTTVPVDQIKITEANKGTPKHTVTITTPDGQSVTFNVFDNYVTDVIKQENGDYLVKRNDGTEWTIELKDIRDKIAALEAKDSPSRDEFNKVKQELADLNTKVDNEFKNIDNRFTKVEGDITNLRTDLTNLENRVAKIEGRLTILEGRTDDLTKCVAGAGAAAIPAMLAIPLMMMTQLNIPGIKDLNTQVQKQIGMYNPELARQWERNGGVLQAGAALATLAGMIGGIAYIAKQCDPMMKTPAGQDTDLGKLSSKLDKGSAKIKEGSSSKKNTEQNGEAKPETQPEAEAPAEAEQPAEQPAENADAEAPVEAEAPAEVDAPEAEAETPATE